MSWRVAEALDTLLDEINERAPDRNKASDGSIGDPAHSARTSDHNPDEAGIVKARDFTHDPNAGADMHSLAAFLQTGRDQRVKYVIWNRRIMAGNAGPSPWQWRPYTGSNPHTAHLHLSVVSDPRLYDSTRRWGWVQEDDMPLSDADITNIAKAVWAQKYGDPEIAVRTALLRVEKRTAELVDMVEKVAVGDIAGAQTIANRVRKELARALQE